MTSQIILFIILIILAFLLSNYTALIYGLRLGKAMQKDIPPSPIEPVVKVIKGAYKLIRNKAHKVYLQKKPAEGNKEDSAWYNT